MVSLVISCFYYAEDSNYKDVNTIKIYAFEDISQTNSNGIGNIFLFQYSASEELKFRYITDGEYGKAIKSDNIKDYEIIDNENDSPRIETITFTTKHKNKGIIKFLLGNKNIKRDEIIYKKLVYIPKGSMKTDFNVDLK
jgi:hypothetical protein